MNKPKIFGKDLTKEAPRSPSARLGGFVILARAIDKCRAAINGVIGEYEFDCPLDNMLFSFKDIKGEDFKKLVETATSDLEIVAWVKENGIPKTDEEIVEWSVGREAEDYSGDPENKEWLEEQNKRLGLPKDGKLFNYLDAGDKASFQ